MQVCRVVAGSGGRACQAATSPNTASVTLLIRSGETSTAVAKAVIRKTLPVRWVKNTIKQQAGDVRAGEGIEPLFFNGHRARP